MAGVSDMAFRTLCREQGADLTYTEMVSAKGLSYANEKTRHLLDLAQGEDVVAVQLFGHEPDVMASQAAWIEQAMADSLAYLDINMGCPAPKHRVRRRRQQAMLDPDRCGRIVEQVVANTKRPVTVKMRKGWDADHITAVECAKACEQAGAALIAVHARTREQMYTPGIDPEIIARVKDAVRVPVRGQRRHPLGRGCSGDDAGHRL